MIRWVRRFIREYPGRAALLAGLGLALFVFGMVWFEPHKLFVDQRVDESLPTTMAAEQATPVSPAPGDPSPEPEGPTILARGRWHSLEHETTGKVQIVELPGGKRILRFEDLATSNGPDLRVYLSEIPESEDWHAYGERFVDLGDLKGNLGSQNYRIPKGTDLSQVQSAVIWCRRFEVGFAVAGLTFAD